MARLLLVHWNRDEADRYARELRAARHVVRIHWQASDGVGFRSVRDDPPDAVLVSLERLPSHGRAVGVWLRQTKATRRVPIVFLGGDPEKVARVRRELPDATYDVWRRWRSALRSARAAPPVDRVVPRTMGAYSRTPLPKKLGVKANATLTLLGAPAGFDETLGPLPPAVRVTRRATRGAALIILFAPRRRDLVRRFPAAARALGSRGALWIAWPKRSSGVESDLRESDVRAFGLERGFVDYKICSIDETWSGLRFARRA